MVRLVFRPYAQIWRSICTSEPLRASTRVSSGFTLFTHRSPSFGSDPFCSYSNPSVNFRIGRYCILTNSYLRSLSLRVWVLTLKHSHNRSTPWSVFQDGPLTVIMPASYNKLADLSLSEIHDIEVYNTFTEVKATFQLHFYTYSNWCWPD